jgi:hypothetical protein
MGQVSRFLRSVEGGFAHWCPACEEMHGFRVEGDGWSFDGNLECPTFNPSMKITGVQSIKEKGEWTGEWVLDANGKALPLCCHYFLHAGQLKFQSDCTHKLKGQTVPLPELPDFMRDQNT